MIIQHNMQAENGSGIFKRVNRDKKEILNACPLGIALTARRTMQLV